MPDPDLRPLQAGGGPLRVRLGGLLYEFGPGLEGVLEAVWPGPPPAPAEGIPDVVLEWLGPRPHPLRGRGPEGWEEALALEAAGCFRVRRRQEAEGVWGLVEVIPPLGDGLAELVLDPSGRRAWLTATPSFRPVDLAGLFLGWLQRWALSLRGRPPLHAAALAIGGRAVLLGGPAGAGKSTSCEALRRRGARVLADDLAALEVAPGEIRVHPGLPEVRLRAGPARQLRVAEAGAPLWSRQGVGEDKVRVRLPWRGEALPLAGLILLGWGPQGLEPLPVDQRLMRALPLALGTRGLHPGTEPAAFSLLSQVCRQVPVLLARRPRGLGGLEGQADWLWEQASRL